MIENILKFCKCVELQSITRAAIELGISQPAITNSIKTLENHYGTKLLIRTSRYVKPTTEGEELYRKSKGMIEKYKEIENLFTSGKPTVNHQLRIGLYENSGLIFLKRVQKIVKKDLGDIDLKIYLYNEIELVKLLEKQQIDFAILPLSDASEGLMKNYRADFFYEEELIPVVNRKVYKRISNDINNLNKEKFITYPSGSYTDIKICDFLEKYSIDAKFYCYSQNQYFMKMMIKQSEYVGFLPKNMVVKSLALKSLYHLDLFNQGVYRQTYVLYSPLFNKQDFKGKEFIDLLLDSYKIYT